MCDKKTYRASQTISHCLLGIIKCSKNKTRPNAYQTTTLFQFHLLVSFMVVIFVTSSTSTTSLKSSTQILATATRITTKAAANKATLKGSDYHYDNNCPSKLGANEDAKSKYKLNCCNLNGKRNICRLT